LTQRAEGVARVPLRNAPGTESIMAGFTVGVDLHANVLLAAGNPLHGGISGKGIFKGDLLVGSGEFGFLVPFGAAGAKVLAALHTVHCGILVIADITLDHPVDVSRVGLG